MGQIRSKSRTDSAENLKELSILTEVLMLAILIFSEVDHLSYPKSLPDSANTFRSGLFPLAVNTLLLSPSSTWRSLAPQLGEWMIQLSRQESIKPELKALFKRTFPALKETEKYKEASMWSKMIIF